MTFRSPNAQPELLSSKGILSRGSTSALSEAGPDGSGYDNRKLVQDFLTIHCIITHIRNIEYVLQVTGNRMEQEYEIGVISCTNQPVWDGTGVFLFRSCAMLVTLSSYAYDEQTGKNLGA